MIGGRLESDNQPLFDAMKARSSGRIAVLAMASGYPEEVGQELVEDFLHYGFAAELIPVYFENRTAAAFDPALISRVEALGSIFFSGGDQSRIVGSLVQDGVETPMLNCIRRCHAQGGLIAGTSAGAAIMSGPMIESGTSLDALAVGPTTAAEDEDGFRLARGLGFFRHGLVDQHFLHRGRLGRLLAACRELEQTLAYGIDENSALIVEGNRGTVVGETGVVLLDLRKARYDHQGYDVYGARLSYLDDGDSVDLLRGKPIPAADKRRVRVSRASYRRPAPVRRHAFSSYALHDLMLRLVEGDPVHYRRDSALAYHPGVERQLCLELERVPIRSRNLRARRNGEIRYSALNFDLHLRSCRLPEHQWRGETATVLPPDPVPGARLVLLGNSPLTWTPEHLGDLLTELKEPIGIFPTASGEPLQRATEFQSWLEGLGRRAEVFDIRLSNVERASRDRGLQKRIGEMGSLLFTGGDQRRLTETLLHCAEATPILHTIVSAYERGVPLIGVAAAASAFAHRMIAEGNSEQALRYGSSEDAGFSGVIVEQGIGLTSFGLVDQNFLSRHRLGRLLVACATQRHRYGFGLCEESGLVILGGERRIQAIGRSGVVVAALDTDQVSLRPPEFDSTGIRLNLVEPGNSFHLDTHAADAVDRSGAAQALLERAVEDLITARRAAAAGTGIRIDEATLRASLLRGSDVVEAGLRLDADLRWPGAPGS
ncbi:MAG: cyanophycinase [Pseudomonadota bacterium]